MAGTPDAWPIGSTDGPDQPPDTADRTDQSPEPTGEDQELPDGFEPI